MTKQRTRGIGLESRFLHATILALFVLYVPLVLAKEPLRLTTIQNAAIPHICEAVINAAYARVGESFKVERYPGKRSLRMANTGVVTGEVCRLDSAGEGVSHLARIPIPIAFLKASVFTKGIQLPIKGWSNLSPYRIGILKGIIFSDGPTRGMNRHEALNIHSLFAMLHQGRVDLVVFAKLDGQHYLMNQTRYGGIDVLSPPLATLPLYHYLHRSHKQLITQITEALSEMEQSGEIKALIAEEERKLLGLDQH